MSINDQDILLIQNKIDGKLSAEEEIEFLRKMENSTEFSQQVVFQEKLLGEIITTQKQEMKAEMLADFREMKGKQVKKKGTSRKPLWYAAAACLALLIVSAIWFNNTIKSPQRIFDEYYAPYDGVVVARDAAEKFSRGTLAYESGEYKEALDIFLSSNSDSIRDGQTCLIIANCYINLQEIETAQAWLDKIKEDESRLILDNRDWYKALLMLKQEEIAKSKVILVELSSSKSAFAPLASELLKEKVMN